MTFHYQKGIYGYEWKQWTFYKVPHLGTDWNLDFEEPPMHRTSRILNIVTGNDGGKTIVFQPLGERTLIRWLHLNKYYCKVGDVIPVGSRFVQTGNTGKVSPKPTPGDPHAGRHLHEDIWPKGTVTLNIKDTINPRDYYKSPITIMKPQYIEQDGKIGFIFDYGQFSVINWATDEGWGSELSDHYKPEGPVLKIVKK